MVNFLWSLLRPRSELSPQGKNKKQKKQRIYFPYYTHFRQDPQEWWGWRKEIVQTPLMITLPSHHRTISPSWPIYSVLDLSEIKISLIYWHFLFLTFLFSTSSVLCACRQPNPVVAEHLRHTSWLQSLEQANSSPSTNPGGDWSL